MPATVLSSKFFHKIYVHLPFATLAERLEQVIQLKINPEIYINADFLDSPDTSQLDKVSHALHDNGLGCTIHGPFMDLCPGAVDKIIRQVSLKRYQSLMQIAGQFAPQVVVFHPGYDDLRYGENRELWLENSLTTWNTVLEDAEKYGLTLALENIFEKDPLLLAKLIKTINSPRLTHCFDVGHYNVFADYPLEDWFELMGEHITEIHLHDNHGDWDEHLALGEGAIDLPAIFAQLKKRNLKPTLVIENHQEEHVFLSLERIENYLKTHEQEHG
jgi:sugar phosphate isomerase/epimerase